MTRNLFLSGILSIFFTASYGSQPAHILSISFEGNKNIDGGKLQDQLRISRAGSIYQAETLKGELERIEEYCRNEGYLRATLGTPKVEQRDIPGKGPMAVITVPLFEGDLYVVGDLTVKNVQAFDPSVLLQMVPLKKGQPYSRRKIAEWQDKIEDGYHTMGYLRFESRAIESIHEFRKVVDCTLECKEGNPYSIGKIEIAGDDSINRSDFKRHLLLGEGGLFNPEMISLSIQFINQMGTYKRISESDVEVKIDDAKATVDLIFHLTSNKKTS
jgi:outer membrane protein insertion porin family